MTNTANRTEGWTFGRVFSRASEVMREEGPVSLFYKVFGETVYRRAFLYERLLTEPIRDAAAGLPVDFDRLGEEDLEDYLAFRPEADPREIKDRFMGGQSCFAGRHRGRIVYVFWAVGGRAWIDYLSTEMDLSDDEIFLYESYARPEYRGMNVSVAMVTEALKIFRRDGYRRALIVLMPENKQAFKPLEKLGFRFLGVKGYYRVGPRRRDFCRGAVQHRAAGPKQAYGPDYWDGIVDKLKSKGSYTAGPLGEIKREAYLDLIRRWGGEAGKGRTLKTDLFEEAMGQDAFFLDIPGRMGSVLGMDLSAVVIEEARRGDTGGRGGYLVADIRRLPFAENTFDMVVSPSTLDHFSDTSGLQLSLRGLRRIIRPGGRLIITLDNRRNLLDPLLRFFVRLGMAPYYIGRSYTVNELRRELAAAGFKVEATTAILHNPRLMAAALASLTGRIDWPPLTRLAHRLLVQSQRLEGTPLKYSTGSFVAALGRVPHEGSGDSGGEAE